MESAIATDGTIPYSKPVNVLRVNRKGTRVDRCCSVRRQHIGQKDAELILKNLHSKYSACGM
jgi:hypothetical protein